MVGTIVHQLTRNLTEEQIREGGFAAYFVNHTTGVYPSDANGSPFTAAALQVKGDPISDIHRIAADAAIAKEQLIKKFIIGQAISAYFAFLRPFCYS
jgi:Mn-containing catalase